MKNVTDDVISFINVNTIAVGEDNRPMWAWRELENYLGVNRDLMVKRKA